MVAVQGIQGNITPSDFLKKKQADRTLNLITFIPESTFKDSFKGDLKFAGKCYDWGFNLPYRLQEAVNLFTGAAAAAVALPALLTDTAVKSFFNAKALVAREEEAVDSLKESVQKLGWAGKIIIVGVPLGLSKAALGVVMDTLKLYRNMARSAHSYFHPECKRICLAPIDIQNDFFDAWTDSQGIEHTKGSLAVARASEILDPVNALLSAKKTSLFGNNVFVAASLDWHPPKHGSFASEYNVKPIETLVPLNGAVDDKGQGLQVAWPDHCIQGTKGAEFAPGLLTDKIDLVVTKGEDERVDSYSALYNNGNVKTKLGAHLQSEQIDTVIFAGLATDFCVKFSALDALKDGYDVVMVTDAMRGILPDHEARTRGELEEAAQAVDKTVSFLTAQEVREQFPNHFKGIES